MTTAIVTGPGRLLADCNKSNRVASILFASDISATGSKNGCPPSSCDILKACLPPVAAKSQKKSRD